MPSDTNNPNLDFSPIMHALIRQVQRAVPPGGSERDVTTLITRPMWRAFLRACKDNEHAEPTARYLDS